MDTSNDRIGAVRSRPGTYLGGTGPLAVAHLVFALVDAAVAVGADAVRVQTGPGTLTVTDDAPVPAASSGGPPQALGAFEDLSFPPPHPTVHRSGDRIGLGVVTAVASALVVTSDADRRWQQVFVQGRAVTAPTDVGPAVGRGTTVQLTPDSGVLGDVRPPTKLLRRRLEEVAVFHPEVAIELDGQRMPSQGGLLGWARRLAGPRVEREVSARAQVDDILVELAVVWSDGPGLTRAFANGLDSRGAHLVGLLTGLRGTRADRRVALVSVTLPDATFDARTHRELRGRRPLVAVLGVVREALAASRSLEA